VPIASLSDADQRLLGRVPDRARQRGLGHVGGPQKRALQRSQEKLSSLQADLNSSVQPSMSRAEQLSKWQRSSEIGQEISKLKSEIQMMEARETK